MISALSFAKTRQTRVTKHQFMNQAATNHSSSTSPDYPQIQKHLNRIMIAVDPINPRSRSVCTTMDRIIENAGNGHRTTEYRYQHKPSPTDDESTVYHSHSLASPHEQCRESRRRLCERSERTLRSSLLQIVRCPLSVSLSGRLDWSLVSRGNPDSTLHLLRRMRYNVRSWR